MAFLSHNSGAKIPFPVVCDLCPRSCGVERAGGAGYCATGQGLEISSICLHRGEEPVLGGRNGMCNIFFSHCNLQCAYCQNWQISRNDSTDFSRMSLDEVVNRVGAILDLGARHVGFVSASHVVPQMKALIHALSDRNPKPVFVMNTNGYDSVETLKSLEGLIDVYLPDLKYMDSALAARLSDAADYPTVAGRALREMHRQKGAMLHLNEDATAASGLIIRHLVLPGHVQNSLDCLRFIAEELSPSVYLSLLSQYEPTAAVLDDPDLGRRLTVDEYDQVLAEVEKLGFTNGWTQALKSAEYYNPDFKARNPFE